MCNGSSVYVMSTSCRRNAYKVGFTFHLGGSTTSNLWNVSFPFWWQVNQSLIVLGHFAWPWPRHVGSMADKPTQQIQANLEKRSRPGCVYGISPSSGSREPLRMGPKVRSPDINRLPQFLGSLPSHRSHRLIKKNMPIHRKSPWKKHQTIIIQKFTFHEMAI